MSLKNFKRTREILLKNTSLSGVINFNSEIPEVQFESSLERDFIYLLEFEKGISEYIEQPLVISYTDKKGNKRTYTPDFLINYYSDDRKMELVEIKYENELISKKDILKNKFKAAEKFCKENDMIFKVITENYIRKEKKTELKNYKFLSRYRDYFRNINYDQTAFPLINTDSLMLQEKIYQLDKSTVRELVNACAKDKDKKAELIFLTWNLVATNFIKADYTKKLNIDSEIWRR